MSEVLIIGAGPAGTVAAAYLLQAGHRVRIVEKQTFPRFSIGESLLAQSTELLAGAGLLDAVVGGGFQYKNGAAFAWREARSEFNFAQKFSAGPGFTFQVPRARFDQILAETVQARGAEIEFGTEIVAADFGDTPTVRARRADGRETDMQPAFVLDASGFGRVLPRLLQLEKPSALPPRSALFTHVEDRIVSGAFDRQKILISVHPDDRQIWYWLIPFSDGRASLGVVGSVEALKAPVGDAECRLWALVADQTELRALLADARPAARVGEMSGYSAAVSRLHGPGYALLGNAAEFLDPVFSSGVTIALKSAQLAARALDRQLRGETVDWRAEFDEPLMLGVETFRGFVHGWYDGSLQDVIFYPKQDPKLRAMICSVLAGYAWDEANPYVGAQSGRRLRTLAEICRNG